MSERDILIERLERKLAEKERELMELRRMNREELEKVKREIAEEVKEEVLREVQKFLKNSQTSEVESKIVELRKAMESIITELAYVKGEIKDLLEKKDSKKDKREIVEEQIQKAKVFENEPLYLPEKEEVEEEKIGRREESEIIVPEKNEEKTDDGEDGLIVCD
ncbi:MAG: hypothetical protein H0Z19_06690 [Archaeoglobus sp.]|uniref:hypothetical protein n=1 Tax=Archaeoglobus sp. TaxID=1872626 RepID=UPI001E1814CE|nr:hypothetical protein [Archaeoglobus sp.]MBO8180154.1 hypothetical protein [Archaeoglobus sp.]